MMQKNNQPSSSRIKAMILFIFIFVLPFTGTRPLPVQAASAPICQNCLFLPVLGRGATSDLALKSIEVTQAVQDEQNSVPLVSRRSTALRIYAFASGFDQPAENVKITVTASRPDTSAPTGQTTFSATVPLTGSRSNYQSTINVNLPESWLTGTIDLTVKIDSDNALGETDENNNTIVERLTFTPVPALRIMVVPIEYNHTPTNHTYAAPTLDTISDWVTRTYPVSEVKISWHEPYVFTGNLATVNDFSRLLSEVTTLKFSENAPEDQIYYGLVPVRDNTSTWFSYGVAGIGWIGLRAAVGLDTAYTASQIAAHEIGHNLGMSHTPCGTTGDPNYPYTNGAIGQYGLDVLSGSVYSPEGSKDFMSYCNPKWVSDYTYKFLLNAQNSAAVKASQAVNSFGTQAAASAEATTRSLFVRATISADGAQLLPSYILNGLSSRSTDGGEYQVQVLNNQGMVIASTAARAYQTGEESAPAYGINTTVALPEQQAASVRLVKDGQVLAEQALQVSPSYNAQAVPSSDDAQVSWGASRQPALVRYSTNGGQTWTTLSVDATSGQSKIPARLLNNKNVTFDVVLAASR